MIFTVITDNAKDPRLQYTLHFVLRTLGYDFIHVKFGEKIPENFPVLTYIEPAKTDQLKNYSPIHIFKSGQLSQLDALEKNINLFDWNALSLPILGRQLTSLKKSGWRFNKSRGYFDAQERSDWFVGFDLIANVFYHLSRYEEKWRHFADETATDYSISILSRYQKLKVPVVDVLLEYLDRLITKKMDENGLSLIRILNWPAGEDFGVGLTHDVDLTRSVSLKERILTKGLGILQTFTGDRENKKRNKEELDARDAVYWSYPHMINFYEEHKWTSTFFFLTRIFEGMHIRYNISSKKFKKLISELRAHGHEIGLHSSLRAFDKRGRYKEEKERIEGVLSDDCTGLRQHYLRAKYPRLWKLAEHAGFTYDSSLSYNFQAGFRAGTSHPFSTYEYDEDSSLNLVEFSLLCFENNLQIDDDAEKVIKGLIAQVSRFHGIFVALWHPSNFLQSPFRAIWDSMITELKKYNIYINTLSGHLNWHKGRSELKISGDTKKVRIVNPAGLEHFSIQVIGNIKLTGSDGAEYKQMTEKTYLLKTKRKQFSLAFSK